MKISHVHERTIFHYYKASAKGRMHMSCKCYFDVICKHEAWVWCYICKEMAPLCEQYEVLHPDSSQLSYLPGSLWEAQPTRWQMLLNGPDSVLSFLSQVTMAISGTLHLTTPSGRPYTYPNGMAYFHMNPTAGSMVGGSTVCQSGPGALMNQGFSCMNEVATLAGGRQHHTASLEWQKIRTRDLGSIKQLCLCVSCLHAELRSFHKHTL